MDVTSANFKEVFPLVEKSIDDAIFVAIDGEFTGLSLGHEGAGQSPLDTPTERYEKTRQSTTKFLLVQFGLVTFHYDSEKGRYSNRGFNFYVWPRPPGRGYPDPRFTCQTSSIDFLVNQGFDFNKLFKEGIGYVRASDEDRLRVNLLEKQAMRRAEDAAREGGADPGAAGATPSSLTPRGSGPIIAIPDDHADYMEEMFGKIEEYLNNWKSTEESGSLDLPKCNPFQRKLLYSHIKPKFGTDLFIETVTLTSGARAIRVTKVDEEGVRRRAAERDAAEMEELSDAVGFTKVVRKLSTSKKLVVGHNMLLDLCHTVNQFVQPLPETLDDFKELMSKALPNICDTKLMASTSPFREEIQRSTLEDLIKATSEKPYQMPEVTSGLDEGQGYALGQTPEKYHDAGYDAFVTGLCFIAMSNRLGSITTTSSSSKPLKPKPILPDSPLVQPFVNKVCLRIPDVPYLNLAGDDVVPDRDHVFHVSFPAAWRTSDLQQLFSSFGPVFVTWIDDTSAYVKLKEHPANAKMVMSQLNCSNVYCIMPYSQHKRLMAAVSAGKQLTVSRSTADKQLIANSGITPTLEKAQISFETLQAKNGGSGSAQFSAESQQRSNKKKRSMSPDDDKDDNSAGSTKKRNKSQPDNDFLYLTKLLLPFAILFFIDKLLSSYW